MNEEIDQEARRMYDLCQTSKPTWDQLGDVTKSVWRERVVLKGGSATQAEPPPSATTQHDLFA